MLWWDGLSDEEFTNLDIDENTAREMLLYFESLADEEHLNDRITQEEAWDRYFLLLHTCDEWGFSEDRKRILDKIDTKAYDPFSSKNPEVVWLARLRAHDMSLAKRRLSN